MLQIDSIAISSHFNFFFFFGLSASRERCVWCDFQLCYGAWLPVSNGYIPLKTNTNSLTSSDYCCCQWQMTPYSLLDSAVKIFDFIFLSNFIYSTFRNLHSSHGRSVNFSHKLDRFLNFLDRI